jgi:serine O-acetyltransferase
VEPIDHTRQELIDYTCAQVANFYPDRRNEMVRTQVSRHLDEALTRLERCINAVRMWTPGRFNYLHSSQYCIYLYYLANTIWHNERDGAVPTRLFGLNKALNGIDLFYEIEMPEVFFIGHSVGIVLAKATYGNYLVLYQNSTVGKNHGAAPVIGEGVVMYPNTTIIGRSHVADGTILSQGTSIINRETPGHCIAYPGEMGNLLFKPSKRAVLDDIFRLSPDS